MTVRLTSLFSPASRCAAGDSGRGSSRQSKSFASHVSGRDSPGGPDTPAGVGSSVKPSGRRRGMNRSCTGSKKLLLQSCCTHGFTAVP